MGEAIADAADAAWPKEDLVGGCAEETLAGPEDDREHGQPQLVHEVVLHQRVYEPTTSVDDHLPVELPFQRCDLVHDVTFQNRAVGPDRLVDGGGNDVLGQARQSLCPGAVAAVPA